MIVITLQFRVLLNLDDTVKVEHPSMWDDRKIRWMGAGGSIWKRPVRIPFFSLMVGNEFLWILCFVTTNFMTALKKLCIHQNHIQKDIGFLNKTKMQNINGELRTAFFERLLHSGFLKMKILLFFCTFCDVTLIEIESKWRFFPEAHGKDLTSLGFSRPQTIQEYSKFACS